MCFCGLKQTDRLKTCFHLPEGDWVWGPFSCHSKRSLSLKPEPVAQNIGHTLAVCELRTMDMSLCTEANIALGSLPSLSPGSKELHTPVSPNLAYDQVPCRVSLFWAVLPHALACFTPVPSWAESSSANSAFLTLVV